MGKVTKKIKKVIKKVAKIEFKVMTGLQTIELTGKVIKNIGNNIVDDMLGFDKVGREVANVGSDMEQGVRVITGEYHQQVKEIKNYQAEVEEFGRYVNKAGMAYNSAYKPAAYRASSSTDELMERLERLIAFEEIFKLALKNRFKDMEADRDDDNTDPRRVAAYKELQLLVKQYELMVRQLKQMMANLRSEFDFVLGLTEGPFLQRLVGSVLMIVGGLVSGIDAVMSGEADSEDWKQVITAAVIIIAVVLTWGAALTALPAMAPFLIAAAILSSIAAFMTLDGMYANGAATGAIMGALDYIFNDVLNLDSFVGSDFNKFNKDHEDYQEMVGYVQLGLSLSAIAVAWAGSLANSGATATQSARAGFSWTEPSTWKIGTADKYGTSIGSEQTQMLAAQDAGLVSNTRSMFGGALEIGDTLAETSVFGIRYSTYTEIYEAFTAASDIKDIIAMNDQYNNLSNKLTETATTINVAIVENTVQKTRLHVADSAYFLQDQQEYIDRYIWSMVSESMYVDPYGTTPVANIRFQPDKDTRGLSFGFEDMFDESKQAGSRGYFNNIIYGS